MTPDTKRLAAVLAIITAVAFALRAVLLGHHVPTPDDLMVLLTADNYISHGQLGPLGQFQPPLRAILAYVGLRAFGSTALGVYGISVVLGTLTVPLLGLFAWRLSGRSLMAAGVAASLLALDILHIDFSRQAIQEVHTAFFFMAGVVLVLETLASGAGSRRRLWFPPVAGIAFGLGMASKGHALPPLLVCLGLLLWQAWRRRRWPEALYAAVCLVGVSFLAYLLTYIPRFSTGISFAEWFAYQRAIYEATIQHTREPVGYLAHNRAAEWFVRPLIGYPSSAIRADGTKQLAAGIGNPLVWMAVLPAFAWSLWKRVRTSAGHRFAQVFFWVAYLPLVLSPRPIWLLSAIAVLPFAYALLAIVVADAAKRLGRTPVAVYLAAVVVAAALLMPLALGYATDYGYLEPVVENLGELTQPL